MSDDRPETTMADKLRAAARNLQTHRGYRAQTLLDAADELDRLQAVIKDKP